MVHKVYIIGLSISSLFVLEYSFHVGYKWVLVNANLTSSKIWGGKFYFVLE